MRSQRILLALVILTIVSAPAVGMTSAPALATCGPGEQAGALGAGDPYFPRYGNGGYDVQHYGLAIRYAPSTGVLRGIATIRALATQDLSCFSLDLVGLTIRSIEVNGVAAGRSRTNHELIVTPAEPLVADAEFTVVVRYDGVPRPFVLPGTSLPSGFLRTTDGFVIAGEPESAATWFPVNDHPTDPATYTFRVTVPTGLKVVANGLRESKVTNGERTTHVWQAHDPMVSYLTTVAVGNFRMRFDETESGVPIIDAVDPGVGDRADEPLARQRAILSFLEQRLGPYPFESVGAIVTDSPKLSFALETQTRPIYPGSYMPDTSVVVHELAHQWFGDLIAVDSWRHIWLNEGFATYAEWLWSGHVGDGTPRQFLRDVYDSIGPDHPFWRIVIGDPGPDDLFHGAVYTRGAMTLQALRNRIGDVAFWSTLEAWIETNGFGTGTTEELIALAEQASGQELEDFFDTWLFEPRKPPRSALGLG